MINRIIISILILSVGFSQKEYDINHILEQNGVYIKKFSDEIVNGKVFQMFGDMKVPLGKMKNGKKEGIWTDWYGNGTRKSKTSWKNGDISGTCYAYREDGTIALRTENINVFDYTKFFYDNSGNPDGYSMVYKLGKKYQGSEKVSVWHVGGQILHFDDPVILYYEEGKLTKREYLLGNTGKVIKVDDCINTDDCLSEKEKMQKNTTSTEKKTIYEQKPFRVSYITHNYGDDIEVELILNNMGNKSYSSVWFNFSFYNGFKMVGKERILFSSLGVFGEEIEIINFDDEFDKIEVELLKFKLN